MSHPNPSQESSYPEDKVTHYPKRKRVRMSQTVNKWATSLMSPHEKALHKAKGRHEKKLNKQ